MTRPNVLWIMSDQHHAGCMGHAGRPEVRTPHLDALAAAGTSYERAYCNSPISGPSRCSMITGLHPHATGITGNDIFDLDVPNPGTLPTLLRAHGYRTGLVGKGHMIGSWDADGFEHARYCDLCDAPDGDPTSVAYYAHLARHGLHRHYDLGARRDGRPGAGNKAFVSDIPEAFCVETWTGDESLKFLDGDDGRPFFLWMSFQRPHEPLAIPPERAGDYAPGDVTLPDNAVDYFKRGFAGKPSYQRRYVADGVHGYPYRPEDEDDLRRQLAAYYTLVTMIDRQIGRVVERLRSSGRYDDTLILYTADHGDFAGEHGLQLKNLGLYDAVARVPLIVKMPGQTVAARDNGLRQLVDLFPTVCDAVGLDAPLPLHGRQLGGEPHDAVCCTWDFPMSGADTLMAIRDDRYRLVFNAAVPLDSELYDVAEDPGELDNLWHEPDLAHVRERLLGRLLQEVANQETGFPRRWSMRDDAAVRAGRVEASVARQIHAGVYDAASASEPTS